MNSLTELLKPYAEQIQQDAQNGDKNAKQIIRLYEMHRVCPNDPGARIICQEYFYDWKASKE